MFFVKYNKKLHFTHTYINCFFILWFIHKLVHGWKVMMNWPCFDGNISPATFEFSSMNLAHNCPWRPLEILKQHICAACKWNLIKQAQSRTCKVWHCYCISLVIAKADQNHLTGLRHSQFKKILNLFLKTKQFCSLF